MKKAAYTIAALIAAALLATFAGGWYMLDYALAPAPDSKDTAKRYAFMYGEHPYMRQWVDSMKQAKALRDTFVYADNGCRHHAVYAFNDSAEGRTAILVHGYKDSHIGMLPIAKIYADMGYNILLPDLHAHGLSEGDHIQMGWNDSKDMIKWIGIADSMFATKDKKANIVIHGVSMGAATTMNLSGENLPATVKCFVEDCGYTSVWDEFSHQLDQQFGLPEFPLLYAANLICKMRYGWTFGEASPLKQLKKKETPMLYIHGSSDDFVPSAMVFPLYNANPTHMSADGTMHHFNDIWISPGCAHAKSFHDYPSLYTEKVKTFVREFTE